MTLNIKHYLEKYFQQPEVNTLILHYIQKKQLNYESLDDNQLISMLQQLKLLDPLLEQINNSPKDQHLSQEKNIYQQQLQLQDLSVANPNTKNISVTITNGRRFEDFKKKFDKSTKFVISMVGFGQKQKTNTYQISDNFNIEETLTFKVNQSSLKPSNRYPIQMAMALIDQNGQSRLYSVKLIQWRYLLCYGSAKFDLQMAPYYHQGTKQMEAVGIIGISMKLSPLSKLNIITEKAVQNELELQKKMKQQNNNIFYKYASDFWNQYKAIHRVFSNRRVKLYTDTQDKILMPLPKLVTPLYNLKGIQSPSHALRFCSLIQFQAEQLNRKAVQKRYSSMLAGKRGNIQDHCNLLCGMLLGFGMKAYVALGYSNQGQHAWVLTTGKDSLTFWQCSKGLKYDYFSPKTFNFYKTVHTIYNNVEYYANIQLDDSIAGTKFNFSDKNLWKSIEKSILEPLSPYNMQLALIPPSINTFKLQQQLQDVLSQKISAYRKLSKLSTTNFDSILSSILTTALTNYQTERITGLTFCEEQFQQAVRSYIPINHTFKAFPIQLEFTDADRIFQEMKNQAKCRQILLSKGESVFFGLRCKVVVFGDNIIALWISLAVRYYKIQ